MQQLACCQRVALLLLALLVLWMCVSLVKGTGEARRIPHHRSAWMPCQRLVAAPSWRSRFGYKIHRRQREHIKNHAVLLIIRVSDKTRRHTNRQQNHLNFMSSPRKQVLLRRSLRSLIARAILVFVITTITIAHRPARSGTRPSTTHQRPRMRQWRLASTPVVRLLHESSLTWATTGTSRASSSVCAT